MKSIDHLPDSEKKQYVFCGCGEWIDCRNLEEVFAHEHQYDLPKPVYTYSIRLGEPFAYRKNKKRIDLN